MGQQLYKVFTTYEGMYIFYLIPIVYFLTIVFRTVYSQTRLHKQIGARGVIAAVAILLIFLDFVYYLYLFLSKTGKILPSNILFVKYAVGFFLWIWVLWYSYKVYFARHVAGEQFTKRRATLIALCVGSIVLGIVGIVVS